MAQPTNHGSPRPIGRPWSPASCNPAGQPPGGGNRRERTFFEEGDYALYRDLLAESSAHARAEVWAYCLVPNHVHIVLVPSHEDGLRRTFADLHRRYTGFVHAL